MECLAAVYGMVPAVIPTNQVPHSSARVDCSDSFQGVKLTSEVLIGAKDDRCLPFGGHTIGLFELEMFTIAYAGRVADDLATVRVFRT